MAGQIISKGPRKWLLRWFCGRDGVGKKHYDSIIFEGTFKQAQGALTDKLAERRKQPHLRPGKQTVEEFYPDWLASKARITALTRSQYDHRYTKDILPYFGVSLLTDITPQLVGRWVTWLQEERKESPRTIQYSVGMLKQILRLAFRWHLIPSVPTEGVELPKHALASAADPGTIQVLTPAQMAQLRTHAYESRDPMAVLWDLLLNSGLRPQEAFALEAGDFAQGNRITISKALKNTGKGGWVVGVTKTKSSRRTVTLPQATSEALRLHLKSTRVIAGLVFRNTAGGPLDISRVRKLWVKACKAAKVPKVRLYDARHSHATALLAAGVHLKVVSARLGHASIQITADTYSHILPEMDDRAAEAMDALLKPPTVVQEVSA